MTERLPDDVLLKNIVSPHATWGGHSCGYCSPPGERSKDNKSYHSASLTADTLTCSAYQEMIDRGWRRSGTYCYKPNLRISCCPQYTIKLDALDIQLSRSHRKALNRWNRFVLEGTSEGTEDAPTTQSGWVLDYITPISSFVRQSKHTDDSATLAKKAKPKKGPAFSSLSETIHQAEQGFLPENTEAVHKFAVTLERSSLTQEKFELYDKYQEEIHKDTGNSPSGFKRFLVTSPLTYEPIPYTKPRPLHLPADYGSYHQMYRLNGKLIAIGVLDILPKCVSSVYFIYDKEYEKYSFGKLSALREAALAQEIHAAGAPEMRYVYMGFYVHSCKKMRYKGEYTPSYLADPETYDWYPLTECTKALDKSRYACFSNPSHSTDAPPGQSRAPKNGEVLDSGNGEVPGDDDGDWSDDSEDNNSDLYPEELFEGVCTAIGRVPDRLIVPILATNYLTFSGAKQGLVMDSTSTSTPSLLTIFGIPDIPCSPIPASKFANNEPLSRSEQESCNVVVSEVDQRLWELRQSRVRLEAALRDILIHREQLRAREALLVSFRTRHVRRLQAPSPAHNLPPEILSKIFLHHQEHLQSTHSPTSTTCLRSSFAAHQGPFLFTWVCRRWRDVAMSTSQLWTTLKLVVDASYFSPPTSVWTKSRLIRLWMERARDIPLRLQVIEHPLLNVYEDPNRPRKLPQIVLADVFECFMRSTSIQIFGSFRRSSCLQAYFPEDMVFPQLEEIRVMNFNKAFEDVADRELLALNAPKLNRVQLNQLGLLSLARDGLSCDRIKHLKLDVSFEHLSPEHIHGLITFNTSLESLELTCIYHGPHPHSTSNVRPISHSTLKQLRLTFHAHHRGTDSGAAGSLAALFGALELPSLVELKVTSREEHPWDDATFHRFFSNTPDLQVLSLLTGCRIEPSQITSYIDLLPSLQDIHVDIHRDFAEDAVVEFRARSSSLLWPSSLPTLYLYPDPSRQIAHIASALQFAHDSYHLDCFHGIHLRRQIRERRQYIYAKSHEAQERETWERKQKLKESLATGRPLPTELKKSAKDLGKDLAFDEAQAEPTSHIDNEYSLAGAQDPKIIITTSRDPSSKLLQFSKEMRLVFPNAHRINRGNYVIKELAEACRANDVTDLIILHEHRGIPDAMIVSHFPHGPTVYFTLNNVSLRHDIGTYKGTTVSEQYPHLIFENFSSRLGERVRDVLKFLFPVPKEDSKRVMTFANEDDFISFRHHVFLKTGRDIQLAEVGPRFEMKPYEIRLGTIEQTEAEREWVLSHYTRTAKKRSVLAGPRFADSDAPSSKKAKR